LRALSEEKIGEC